MWRVIDRIRAGLAVPASSGVNAGPAIDDAEASIKYVLVDPANEAKPRSLITYLGQAPINIGEIINSVAFACQLRGEYPLVAMSELKPDLIAVTAVPIEFVPTLSYLPVEPDEYERYLRRRWSLMLAKWNVTKQIDLDLCFDDFVEGQLADRQSSRTRLDHTLASDA